MRAILSDIERQFNSLVALLNGPELRELWNSFGVETFLMRDVGLSHTAPDREIWTFCQTEQYVLITGNRRLDDSDSLEQTHARFYDGILIAGLDDKQHQAV